MLRMGACERVMGVAQQVLQQRKLAHRQVDPHGIHLYLAREQVERERAELQLRRDLQGGRFAALQGAQTGQQFLKGKRLGQVVIGPSIQPAHLVLDLV